MGEDKTEKVGFQIKKWPKLDVSKVNVHELKRISEGTGVDFPIEADSQTGKAVTTPESIVVNVRPGKKK